MRNLTFKAAMLNDSRTTVNRQSTDGQSQRHYKQTPLSKRWKVLMTLVFLFTFAIGQMWGHTFSSANIVAGNVVQDNVTVTGTATSTTKVSQYYKVGSTKYAADVVQVKGKCNGGTLEGITDYIEIKASANCYLNSPIVVRGSSNGTTTDKNLAVLGWNGDAANNNITYYEQHLFQGYDQTSLEATDVTITFTVPLKTIRIYAQSKVKDGALNSSGTQKGAGSAVNILQVTATAGYFVTINPNGGAYASTPSGWSYDNVNKKYTKYVASGSFSAPDGLSKGTDVLSWKDNHDNDITFPVTINKDTIFVAQWATSSCNEPTTAFANGSYTVDGTPLTLSSLISDSQGEGTISYSVKEANGTGASITAGVFTATTAGSATVTATQAADATNGYCEKIMDATITVLAAGAVEYNINYAETKGASNSNPAKYTKGTGIAEFAALADVTDFHFTGWDPASISSEATGDQTVTAQWVAAYNVTFDKNGATGTAPDAFQKWNGATFNLPDQGSMVAPSGKAFDGWKANGTGDKLAAGAEYTMGAAAVQFVAQWKPVIKLVKDDGSLNTTDFSAIDASLVTEDVTVEGKNYSKTVKVGGAASGIPNVDAFKKVISYETTTDATHVKISLYDVYSSSTTHKAYVMIVKEGEVTPIVNETISITISTKRDCVKEYDLTGHSNLYICVEKQDIRVCQIEVNENGTALEKKEAPAVGYSINLNKGRLLAPVKQTNTAYEGLTYNLAEKYLPGSSADARIKNLNSEFISFVVPTGQTRQLQLTTSNTNNYTVSKTKGDDQNQFTPTANTAKSWNLTAGTWYINPQGSNVQITNIAFATAPAAHTISFDSDGGSDVASIPVFDGDKATAPADPTKEHAAFVKWVVKSSGADFDWTANVTDDVTLKAIWTQLYTISFANGGGSGDAPATVADKAQGETFTVPANTYDAPTGKVFAGWNDGSADYAEGDTYTVGTDNVVLTAQWVNANFVARIGSTYYTTLADALLHAADGEIVLLQDIDVTAQVEIAAGVTATIDLAGHKIEYTGSTTLSSGVILVHNGGSLTINDSSDPDAGSIVSGEKAYAAIALTKAGDDAANPATLVVNGGTLTGHYYGITGNGSRNNTDITINGGTITGTVGIAIYHPQVGTLTVNNGSLTGEDAAIEMRAGTLVINDGTFTATATVFSCDPNGSGSTTSGAAIAIAQHTTKKEISVTINGGTFNGVKALNESNPQVNDPAPQVTMAVTAGTFTGEVTTVDVDKFISGGTFSVPVAEENCATGYVPETKANGKYGVIYPAQSIDFEAIIDTYGTDDGKAELDGQLSSKHYDIDGTLNEDRLDAGGFKVKKTGLTISFSVEKAKVVEITTGHISGASIKVDGADAVAMEGNKKHTYYSDDAQAFLITMTATGNAYNIFKSINIRDPYKVSFDVNGGDAPIAPRFATPSVTLPDATNGTQNFAGWYTDADVFVGMNGDSYTPTADITLVAHWEALSTINTLSDLKVDGATVDGFDADVHTYYIELPYGTDVSNLPKITAATPTNANATVNIYPAAAPEWTDDFGGCYRQQANVTPQDPAAAIGYNDIRITIAPKDPLCIIKAEHDGTATGATVTGFYGGTKDKKTANNGKLGDANQYFGIKLAEEAGTFKAGDVLKIYATNPSAAVRIYSDKATTRINATDGTFDSEKMFTYTLTGDEEWIYLYRRYKETETDMNPTLGYMAVYRPVPNPLVKTITFNGAAGAVDNTASPKTITVEVPASTDVATMPVVATFYSNDPSQTSGAVTGGTWAEGINEYIVTDKDNDQTVYTVTITKAVPSSDATLSALSYGTPATAIALADGVYEYDVLLPYGTSDVPALAATAHHAGATIESIADAAAFVDRKATSTVTVKAEDNATTQEYTINFIVDRYETTVLWDASVNDNLSQLTGCTTAGISVSDADDVEFEGKTYGKKALSFGGKTKNDRYLGIQIPNGKVAKVSIVYKSRGTSARSIMLATALASAIDEQTIVSATAETQDLARMTADIFAGGTIYINTTDGFYVYEIDVQFADGYGRSTMLGAGVYGTICVPNNVAVEDIQGVTVYELMGRESQYGKLAFDEIISGELEAGVPYVFQAHRNHMALLYGETSVADPVDKHNGMYGTFIEKELTELNDVYYFAQKALWGCADLASLKVPANRAYVKLSEVGSVASSVPAPGRRRISMAVNGEQVATGIENTGFESEAPRKVLINGELYIIRGEKMYDAKGQLVK